MERISAMKIKAKLKARVRVVRLDGTLDKATMAMNGASLEAIATFRNGFPENWQSIYPRPPPPPPPPPPGPRRSTRVAVVDDIAPPVYDEDALLLRELRKREADCEKIDLFEDLKGDAEVEEEDDWTEMERAGLKKAVMELNSKNPLFWERLSKEYVVTRTVQECQDKWLHYTSSGGDQVGGKKNKQDGDDDDDANKIDTEEEAMKRAERVAKMGTARFRKQIRENWEKIQTKKRKLNGEELTTPFREKMGMTSLSCCKDVATPMATFQFEGGVDAKKKNLPGAGVATAASAAIIGPSPDVLISVNRNNLDGYVVGLMRATRYRPKITVAAKAKKSIRGCNSLTKLRKSPRISHGNGMSGFVTPGGSVKLMGMETIAEEDEGDDAPSQYYDEEDEEEDDGDATEKLTNKVFLRRIAATPNSDAKRMRRC